MSEEQLRELQEYNLEYLEAQASEEMFGGDFTSAVELKQAKKEIERLNNIINKKEQFLGDNIKRLEREVVKRDNIINELNNAYCKVITKCEEMIDSRFYMNDIAIKKYADEIKDICKYYVGEAKELKGSDKE